MNCIEFGGLWELEASDSPNCSIKTCFSGREGQAFVEQKNKSGRFNENGLKIK